jgi:hypothetical protein
MKLYVNDVPVVALPVQYVPYSKLLTCVLAVSVADEIEEYPNGLGIQASYEQSAALPGCGRYKSLILPEKWRQ